MTGRMGLLVIALAAMAGGCGDDDTGTPDGGVPDAGVRRDDAAPQDAPLDAGSDAGDGDAGMPTGCPPVTRMLATTSDFATGALGVITLASGEVALGAEALEDQDTVPALAGCTPLLLERGLGRVKVLSGADPRAIVATLDVNPSGATGPYAANPVAALGLGDGRAYVVLGAASRLSIVDLGDGADAAVVGEIDLSPLAAPGDPDGNVDALDLVRAGDRVYVALGRTWFDAGFAIHFEGSVLAVIDPAADALVDVDPATDGVQGIELDGENPWRGMAADEAAGRLYLAASGDSFAVDGHVEVVDLAMGRSLGPLVTEATLGGELGGLVLVSPTRLAVIAGPSIVAFDPTAATITPSTIGDGGDGLARAQDHLAVWSRAGAAPGLRLLSPADGADVTPTGAPIPVGALPISGLVGIP